MKTCQKFASVHANVHNHFNQERHLRRSTILQVPPLGRIGRIAAVAHGLSCRPKATAPPIGDEKAMTRQHP